MYKFHYSHSFRLVTFSAAAAVPSLLHSQQFIMPSVRISKGVWGRRKSQRSVPRKWHKCRTELGLNRNRKIMASALCCSLSRGIQRRCRRLRHPLAFLCGMKFEWGSKRIKTWDGWGEGKGRPVRLGTARWMHWCVWQGATAAGSEFLS